jgi:hypothetical protein
MFKAPMSKDPDMKKGAISKEASGKDGGQKKEDGTKGGGLLRQSPGADFRPIRPETADL